MTNEQHTKNERIIDSLQDSADILETTDFGKIECWNWLAGQEQNADEDGVSRERMVTSALCHEAESVAQYFKALGYTI